MKLEIRIAVNVPALSGDQHAAFIQKVMEIFQELFPEAEHLPYGKEYIPPVTVTIATEEGSSTRGRTAPNPQPLNQNDVER